MTNPYKGILSEDAIKQIDAIIAQTDKKTTDVVEGKESKMTRQFIAEQTDKTVAVIVADLDKADGKTDGKISGADMHQKIEKLLDAMNTQFPESPEAQQMIQQWKANMKNMKQEINAYTLTDALKMIFHSDDDVRFHRVDKDGNGEINTLEMFDAAHGLPRKLGSPFRII